MYEDILLEVRRPAQYIGHEWNSACKDFDSVSVKVALSFPDLYEVGMSNLGVRIIYGLLNSLPDVLCERFFAVGRDLEESLRLKGREILSLESKKRLIEFDLAGFSLGSELNYTNVLNILDLAHFPLKASLRDHTYPLVIGGGPCTLNPEPMHDFFDLFVIGEAEELILEILNLYRRHKEAYKANQMTKAQLLRVLSALEGVYAPCLYEVNYDKEGGIGKFQPRVNGAPSRIKKRFVGDLDSSFYPREWVVPYAQIIHDRVALEIMRGCPHRCRFCQARSQYFPLRYRNMDSALALAKDICRKTGYEELSLSGLSVGDYPRMEELLNKLTCLFRPKGVGVSLPSVKATQAVGVASSMIAKFKKTGLTFAPEAGSQGLRDLLAKDFSPEDFFAALKESYAAGYQHVKLYFMIGIPSEKDEDLDAIIDFACRVSDLRRDTRSPPANVNVSINSLIPKPHTPLQWAPMEFPEEIKRKQDYIRKKSAKLRRLKVSFHNPNMSFLEGVLSRGDRRLSQVISSAFKRGARFDAWSSYFDFGLWDLSFKESGIDPYFYLKGKRPDELLPWDFIDTGIDKSLLCEEFKKTIAI